MTHTKLVLVVYVMGISCVVKGNISFISIASEIKKRRGMEGREGMREGEKKGEKRRKEGKKKNPKYCENMLTAANSR